MLGISAVAQLAIAQFPPVIRKPAPSPRPRVETSGGGIAGYLVGYKVVPPLDYRVSQATGSYGLIGQPLQLIVNRKPPIELTGKPLLELTDEERELLLSMLALDDDNLAIQVMMSPPLKPQIKLTEEEQALLMLGILQ